MGTILKSILPTSLRGLRLNSLTIGKAIPIYNFLFEAQDGKLSHIILSKLALKAQNFFLNSRRLFFFFFGNHSANDTKFTRHSMFYDFL